MASGTIWAQGIKLGTGAGATTAYNLVSTADYTIDKVASTYYARPGIGTGLTAYSGASFKTTIESAMGQLTTGGTVFLNFVLADAIDPIVVPYSYITIQGRGKYLTKLKLKANADAAGGFPLSGMIYATTPDYLTVKDLELDGNGANQTLVDDGASTTARMSGVRFGNATDDSDFGVVDNCYIHDFTQHGVQASSNDCIIKNTRAEDNYWNNISLTGNRNKVINCQTHGGGDVSIAMEGDDNQTIDCFVTDLDGSHGSVSSRWGIAIEAQGALNYRNSIINCRVTGANIKKGIASAGSYVMQDVYISGNYVYDILGASASGISISLNLYSTISNNRVTRINGQGILVSSTNYSSILGNDVSQITYPTVASPSNGIGVGSTSTYNRIIGNTVDAKYALDIGAASNYNLFESNTFKGETAARDFADAGTGNIFKSNYLGFSAKWLKETGLQSNTNTATSDGLTTGIIVSGNQNLTVTSNTNDAYIISLPAASASTIGTKITGLLVGGKICVLRTQSAQEASVYINGITGAGKGAAIPVASSFEVTQVDATHWILKAWTTLGAEIAAIVLA